MKKWDLNKLDKHFYQVKASELGIKEWQLWLLPKRSLSKIIENAFFKPELSINKEDSIKDQIEAICCLNKGEVIKLRIYDFLAEIIGKKRKRLFFSNNYEKLYYKDGNLYIKELKLDTHCKSLYTKLNKK